MGSRRIAVLVGASLLLVAAASCNTTGMIVGSECNGHGDKTVDGCVCDDGYGGDSCGNCAAGYQDNDGDGTCNVNCETAGLTCDPPNQCVDYGGVAECDCERGYTGDDCTACAENFQDNDSNGTCEPSCSNPDLGCGDHGTCDDSTGSLVCNCEQGYGGDTCDVCASQYQDNDGDGVCTISCSNPAADCNHGTCDDSTGGIVCNCDAAYTGDDCSQCADGYQDNDSNGTCLPTCQTAGYTCSGLGSCVDSSGEAVCNCPSGYQDDGAGNCIEAPDLTFIVTHVNDGLNANDYTIMKDGLTSLGYDQVGSNTNVSTSQLINYLQTDATVLYHTGHGDYSSGSGGMVLTANNGLLYTDSTVVNTVNTVFATCLTLTDTGWKNQFGATAQNICGYTNYSYDSPVDDQLANDLLDELGNGKTFLQAWYLSNASNSSLDDRWCVYARTGGTITEYSARTGNHPAALQSVGSWVSLMDNIRVAEALADDWTDHSADFAGYVITGADATQSSVAPGDLTSWLKPTSMSESEAIGVATTYLISHGQMPADAVLGEVIAIEATPDGATQGSIAGYTVRFEREVDGLPVRGNGVADHVTVLIGGGRAVAVSEYWPDLAGESTRGAARLMPIGEAITNAAPDISRALKTGLNLDLVSAELVYGSTGPRNARGLRPAYQVTSADGLQFVIDAETGTLLR